MADPTCTTPESNSPCSCGAGTARSQRIAKWTTAGGFVAALGICAACCLLPFALVTAGVATAWAGTLEALAPYKWIFVAVTVALVAHGFYVAYRKPRAAGSVGTGCATCRPNRSLRIGLWVVTALALAGLAFEQIEPQLR
jgi:mercuric ion transport protein